MTKTTKTTEITIVIIKDVKGNPRRESTWGFQSFALIKNGMSLDNYITKGGRMKDLRWDLAHGYCHLEEKK
jgi:hypothetical protein